MDKEQTKKQEPEVPVCSKCQQPFVRCLESLFIGKFRCAMCAQVFRTQRRDGQGCLLCK
jgi:hypothetical protein